VIGGRGKKEDFRGLPLTATCGGEDTGRSGYERGGAAGNAFQNCIPKKKRLESGESIGEAPCAKGIGLTARSAVFGKSYNKLPAISRGAGKLDK